MKTTTRITDVRTIAIPVMDQDRAVGFYTEKLGFEVRMDAELGPGLRWVEVAPAGATTSVALITAGDEAPAGADTGIRFVSADAKADHAELRSLGVDTDDLILWEDVPPMFSFRDLDGNTLYLVEDMES